MCQKFDVWDKEQWHNEITLRNKNAIGENTRVFFTQFNLIDLHNGERETLWLTIIQKLLQDIIKWVIRKYPLKFSN